MYLNILKKDLKRKKAMNVILLIFIILATMFVSSSVNNILTISTALEDYFAAAGVPDYLLATTGSAADESVKQAFADVPEITDCKTESIIYMNGEVFFVEDEPIDFGNTAMYTNFSEASLCYFDADNQPITEVKEGTVFVAVKPMKEAGLEVGDVLEIRMEGVSVSLTVAGVCKDAVLGSDLMGNVRLLVNEKDFAQFSGIPDSLFGKLWYVNTTDVAAVTDALADAKGITFNGDRAMIKMAYVLDMVIAGILLVVSICLILIAFVVLRFTITFTLSEDFREIGVMKAIGIRNTAIRSLYLVKYFFTAVIGAAIGFFGSIPFANLLIGSVSDSIVLEHHNIVFINLLCCIFVVLLILFFCYTCTAQVRKLSPLDAIRSGQTGERFSKKGILRLGKTSGRPAFFMALNDILSSPKRYATIILTYTLCTVLVLILCNGANTLRSDKLIHAFGMYKSDLYLSSADMDVLNALSTGGEVLMQEKIDEIEKTLAEEGMPAECTIDMAYRFNYAHGDRTFTSMTLQGVNTTTDYYSYHEGTPPQNPSEAAITPTVSEKLDAGIGDTITFHDGTQEHKLLVTAIYQSMNNLGEGVRLHEDLKQDYSNAIGFFQFQLNFEDHPDEAEIAERAERIAELFDIDMPKTAGEVVEETTGVAGTISAMRTMMLVLSMIIIAMVTLLMERSFIAKERGEIAMLKAMGFRTGTIMSWHSLRFVIIGILSVIIGAAASPALTKLCLDPIFKMLGARFGVPFEIKPLEVFVIYPAVILAVTIISALLTSLYTKTITAAQASGIE
ncbi:MAG: FtsX-like permease family protein [Oscillospiraceae bacterium]|nr:FtsX-like permease family protein [Oscillospiraceae bacterium]